MFTQLWIKLSLNGTVCANKMMGNNIAIYPAAGGEGRNIPSGFLTKKMSKDKSEENTPNVILNMAPSMFQYQDLQIWSDR
jgi:hypothetical protein